MDSSVFESGEEKRETTRAFLQNNGVEPETNTFFSTQRKKMKQTSTNMFVLGMFCGIVLNFAAIVFVFCVKSRSFIEGYSIGILYFCFFVALAASTFYIYKYTGIAH